MNNIINSSIIRQQFAQCVFNHKIHEKSSDRLLKLQAKLKWINILFLGLVIVFLVLQIKFPNSSIFGAVSVAITVFEILYLFMQKEFSIDEKSNEHKKIALQYLGLRDKYKNFIADIENGLSQAEIISKRDLLQEHYNIISCLSLESNYKDYVESQISLLGKNNSDEEFTWSDKEVNRFLPKELHMMNRHDI